MKTQGISIEHTMFSGLEALPIKPGDKVRIPKGATIRHSLKGEQKARKNYAVTVEAVTSGMVIYDRKGKEVVLGASVVWQGDGGYQVEANINDVEQISKDSPLASNNDSEPANDDGSLHH